MQVRKQQLELGMEQHTGSKSENWNELEWVNLTQMTIISTTVGRNPLEEME